MPAKSLAELAKSPDVLGFTRRVVVAKQRLAPFEGKRIKVVLHSEGAVEGYFHGQYGSSGGFFATDRVLLTDCVNICRMSAAIDGDGRCSPCLEAIKAVEYTETITRSVDIA